MNPANLRIGIGHDTHRLKTGGPLRLGGIDIPFDKSLDGHSDADVLLHAVTDAVLGAAALGDIGELFPNTSAENKNRCSIEMLQIAMGHVREKGYKLLNVDCIVFAQKPKLSDHKQQLAKSVAHALDIESRLVGIKAKTGEGIGDVGQENCMMAQCIALMYLEESDD